ncbi:MAG TPA: cytochrome c oxidase subunit II [Gammaproteobacteria bacterium]|nr:cytochrome c oxidase subunit II [Gammaproteobacteria bacterium]
MRVAAAALPPIGLLAGGCSLHVPVLQPQGPLAARLAEHIWLFTIVSAVVWLLVMLALAIALLRRRRRQQAPELTPDPDAERRIHVVIGLAVAATVLVLLVLNVNSYLTDRALLSTPAEEPLTIHVTGHQWWWEVRYEDPRPDRVLTTANEIHIPVGRPVRFKLTSADVIHSFWVPSLMGKQDLVTGRENLLTLIADRPGVYRGQCAEFCGAQHAHMGLLVIAQLPAEFDAWQAAQLRPAEPPSDPLRQKGQQVFLSQPCTLCHQIRGTPSGGRVGPDLTHVGSRRTLAAGALPNTPGNLAAWITDPQTIKPGAHMPVMQIPSEDLQALLAYLEGLE